MSERDGYEPGVPCWVATVHPDPEKAVSFYTELFAWEATNLMPRESPSKYFVCRRHGRDVAAIGSERGGGAPSVPAWDTYIWAKSADDTVAKVTDAGGSVVIDPFDRLDAARRSAPIRRVRCSECGSRVSTGAHSSSTSRVHGP